MNGGKYIIRSWQMVWVIFALIIGLGGCARQDPLFNPPAVTYPNMTMEDMEAAIFEGCAKRGWSPAKVQEGVVDATLYLREHVAVVRIAFVPGRFTIKYVSSEKLNYGKDKNGGEVIHPHYNDWVQNLKNDITVELAKREREKKAKK
jgi:hypothetical protein